MKTKNLPGDSRFFTLLARLVLAIAIGAGWQAAVAGPVNSQRAAAAVKGWLQAENAPLGERLGGEVERVDTFRDDAGTEIYHVVYLKPGGFAIVAADDLAEPIVCFAPRGQFQPGDGNPLGALVGRDLPNRVARAQRQKSPLAAGSVVALSAAKWQRLEQADLGGTSARPRGIQAMTDVRVPPLTQSLWSQGTSGGTACYNYYTPPYGDGNVNNYPAGCVATAMAQLMRYYQFPTTGVGTTSFTVYSDGSPRTYYLRGGDGAGGPYLWANMPLMPGAPTTAQCQAIGALVADAGATVNMSYSASGSSSALMNAKGGLVNTFHFANAIRGWNNNNNLDLATSLTGMLNPNLDALRPALLSIRGSPGGHAVVADGYGYSSSTLYHHLNLGWAGADSAWYALPTIDTSQGTFTIIDGCVYNAYTNGAGEIISGRVLDQLGRPVADATVTATRAAGGTYTASTDTNGIYALAAIPSASSYSITISKPGFSSASGNFSTGTSSDNSAASGNYWGANFTMNMLPTAVDHIVWSTIAPTQSMNAPFAVSISAQNATNGPAIGFTGPVALSAYASGLGSPNTVIGNLSLSGWWSGSALTLGFACTPGTNLQVTAVRSYSGDKVSIWTDSGALVASQSVSGSAGTWTETPLANPVVLCAGTTYRVGFHCAAGVLAYYAAPAPASFANGTVGQILYYSPGDVFPAAPKGTNQVAMADLGYFVAFSNSVPVSPASSGAFANGAWGGNLTLSQAVTNLVLKADDGAGHIGLSNPFNVINPNAVPPAITTQPQSRTNNTGDNAAFSLVASSGQTPGYYWRRNGSPLSGANASSYTVTNVQLPDCSSQFSCLVSNAWGAVTSQTATLTVICTNVLVAAQPHLTLGPAGAIVNALAASSDGAVIFGGYFTSVNGVTRSNIARLKADGSLDPNWNPAADDEVLALAISGTNLYAGGYFTNIGGLQRVGIAKLSLVGSGAADAAWTASVSAGSYSAYVDTIAVSEPNVFAGGFFNRIGGVSRVSIARMSSTGAGAVDATWNPSALYSGYVGYVDAIVASGGNVFVGGYFNTIGTLGRSCIAKLSSTGSGAADSTWNPNANGEVFTITVNGTDVYAGGDFSTMNGAGRSYVAKLSSSGSGAPDPTWNPGADAPVWAIAARGTSIYLGGGFTNIGGMHRYGLAKLSASGTGPADPAWDANPDNMVQALASGTTNLWVGGAFAQLGGQSQSGVASLSFPSLKLSGVQRLAGGQFQFVLAGEKGQVVDVLGSTNLVDWPWLATLTNSTGSTNYTDPTTSLPRRFYRARQQQ